MIILQRRWNVIHCPLMCQKNISLILTIKKHARPHQKSFILGEQLCSILWERFRLFQRQDSNSRPKNKDTNLFRLLNCFRLFSKLLTIEHFKKIFYIFKLKVFHTFYNWCLLILEGSFQKSLTAKQIRICYEAKV